MGQVLIIIEDRVSITCTVQKTRRPPVPWNPEMSRADQACLDHEPGRIRSIGPARERTRRLREGTHLAKVEGGPESGRSPSATAGAWLVSVSTPIIHSKMGSSELFAWQGHVLFVVRRPG